MKRLWLLGLMGLALAVGGVGCPPDDTDPGKERIASLRGFGSAEELRSYLAEQASARYQGSTGLFGLPVFGGGLSNLTADTSGAAPGAAAEDRAGSESADSFSTTNIQETGVDESDIVKNDGQYIYILEDNTIHIVKAVPPEALAELATIDIEAAGDSLYLSGGKLVALSRRTRYYYYDDMMFAAEGGAADTAVSSGQASQPLVGGEWNDGAQTTVTVINVADPAQPIVEATLKFEGELASSRLIDDLLYLVLTTTPRLPESPTPLAIAGMSVENWIPDYELVAADGSVRSGDIAGWDSFFRPEDPDGYGLTTVVAMDIQSPTSPFKTTAISANAGTIYASTKALYVTDMNYDWRSSVSRTDTAIHKLLFTPEGTAYVGSGLVPGRLLNQYSLGEYEDNLRVATTVEQFSIEGTVRQDNNVYVLALAEGSLVAVGKIEGIAPGEQIYSARFVGPRGFLVTFRRIDPLFTLDLSEPANPRVAGELKVPGYSDHIQLLDENHLLTIGKDALDAGTFAWMQGVQLSVFDVTDPAHPALLHKEVIGGRGSESEANHNPKAFNYFAAANALAFPMDVYGTSASPSGYGGHEFVGLYVYRVTVENGFQLLGRIPSTQGTSARGCFYSYYGFNRGVFMGDTVYSVTERDVKACPLNAVGLLLGQVTLTVTNQPVEDCFGIPELMLPVGVGIR